MRVGSRGSDDVGFAGAGLAAFAQAVGVAADVHDGGFVQEAVERGAGHDGVAGEDVGPFTEGLVGGEHDRPARVVALADDLEEQRGLGLIEGEVADLVDDQQRRAREVLHLAMQAVFGEGLRELAGQVDRAGEGDTPADLGAGDTQRDGQVRLPNTGRPAASLNVPTCFQSTWACSPGAVS